MPTCSCEIARGRVGIRFCIQRSSCSTLQIRPTTRWLHPRSITSTRIGAQRSSVSKRARATACPMIFAQSIRAGVDDGVPAGARCSIISAGSVPTKLRSACLPPNHGDAVVPALTVAGRSRRRVRRRPGTRPARPLACDSPSLTSVSIGIWKDGSDNAIECARRNDANMPARRPKRRVRIAGRRMAHYVAGRCCPPAAVRIL